MKYKEITALSKEEKIAKIEELKKELMKFNTQSAKGTPPEKAGSISQMKRDVSRLLKSLGGGGILK